MTNTRVHDRHRRHPVDLPWRACSLQFALTVRRVYCDNNWEYRRRTFAESFGPALVPHARRTTDADALLLDLAEAARGEEGARLAHVAGLSVSPGTHHLLTLLRLLHRSPLDPVPYSAPLPALGRSRELMCLVRVDSR